MFAFRFVAPPKTNTNQNVCFQGKADIPQARHDVCFWPLRLSAWCPKGQFISRRVEVKIGLGEHGG